MRQIREIKDIPRFWSRVRKTDSCWLWEGYKINGYGVYADQLAHRIAWTLGNGPIPYGKIIRHSCNNPACVNPEHLFLGTHGDNNRDTKGANHMRPAFGERHGRAKLTVEKVREIRRLRGEGMLIKDLAEQFGVSPAAICNTFNGKGWKSVPLDDVSEKVEKIT